MNIQFTALWLIKQTLLRSMSLSKPKSPRWCHASHTHAVTQSAVDCSLHPAAPAALSSARHPLWASARGTTRASSPIQSGLVCCCPSPGRSASVRWCWSGAWPSLPETRCPIVAGQSWHKEMRPGAERKSRRPCFMNATVACISNELPKNPKQKCSSEMVNQCRPKSPAFVTRPVQEAVQASCATAHTNSNTTAKKVHQHGSCNKKE